MAKDPLLVEKVSEAMDLALPNLILRFSRILKRFEGNVQPCKAQTNATLCAVVPRAAFRTSAQAAHELLCQS
jgi:hypothetical protein